MDGDSIDDTMAGVLESINAGGGDGSTGSDTNVSDPGLAGSTPPAGNSGVPGVGTPEPWRSPPKSWKREMHDYYSRTDPQVMQYIHQREEEALRGIGQYKSVADKWNQTLTPYAKMIQQYNLNPHDIVSSLTAAHTILKFGTPQQKMAVVQLLDRDYGLRQFFQQNGQIAPPSGPDFSPIANKVQELEARLNQGAEATATTEVERFIADPANEFAADAAPNMLKLLEQGRASSLKEAYDIAVKTDPVLFERYIAKVVETRTRGGGGKPPTNVRPSGVPSRTAGTTRGTIDDTMRATLATIQSR